MTEAAVAGLVLLVALVAPLALYIMVRAEHDQRREMDRESAERVARRDTDDEL
jgi:multisubunit Na+/H+ antiporter MnhG subunit